MAQPTTKQSSSDKTSDVQNQKNLSKVSSGADKKVRDKAYNDYVESITPKHKGICDGREHLLHRAVHFKYL